MRARATTFDAEERAATKRLQRGLEYDKKTRVQCPARQNAGSSNSLDASSENFGDSLEARRPKNRYRNLD